MEVEYDNEEYVNVLYPKMKERARYAIATLKKSKDMTLEIIEPQQHHFDNIANGVTTSANDPGCLHGRETVAELEFD